MIRKRKNLAVVVLLMIACVSTMLYLFSQNRKVDTKSFDLRNKYVSLLEKATYDLSHCDAFFLEDAFIVHSVEYPEISVLVNEESANVYLEKMNNPEVDVKEVNGSDLNLIRLLYGALFVEQYDVYLSSILPEEVNYAFHIDAVSPYISLDVSQISSDSYLKQKLVEMEETFYLNVSVLIDINDTMIKNEDLNEINTKIMEFSFELFENSKLQCTVASSIADMQKYPAHVLWELFNYGEKATDLVINRITKNSD